MKIGELNYSLNLGTVSQEKCFAVQNMYIKQSMNTLDKLDEWHKKLTEIHGISLEYKSRKRKGMDAAIHWIPSIFNGKHKYKSVSDQVIGMIEAQSSGGDAINHSVTNRYYYLEQFPFPLEMVSNYRKPQVSLWYP